MRNEWHNSVADWGDFRLSEYFEWVKNTYGREEVVNGFKYLDEYRAVKDVQASVEPETNPYTDALAHSMLHTKQVLAAGIMDKVFKDVYEEHGKALLNEYNQP